MAQTVRAASRRGPVLVLHSSVSDSLGATSAMIWSRVIVGIRTRECVAPGVVSPFDSVLKAFDTSIRQGIESVQF